jgi:hypothetical protein
MGMVRTAKVNGIIREYMNIKTALNSFYIELSRLPGDINRDGRILRDEGGINESIEFWRELSYYNLMGDLYYKPNDDDSGSNSSNIIIIGTTIPASKYDRKAGWYIKYYMPVDDNVLLLASFDKNGKPMALVSSNDSKNVDLKLDDGKATDGIVHGINNDGNGNDNSVICYTDEDYNTTEAPDGKCILAFYEKAVSINGLVNPCEGIENCVYTPDDPEDVDYGIAHILYRARGNGQDGLIISNNNGNTNRCTIDWGDNTQEGCPGSCGGGGGCNVAHTYSVTNKDYHIKIRGSSFTGFKFSLNYNFAKGVIKVYSMGKWGMTELWNLFQGCENLNYISPNAFMYLNRVGRFNSAFQGATSLTSIPSGLFRNNTNVNTFENAFYGATNLKCSDIEAAAKNWPRWNASGVNMSNATKGCKTTD